jgi:hypothetical protein
MIKLPLDLVNKLCQQYSFNIKEEVLINPHIPLGTYVAKEKPLDTNYYLLLVDMLTLSVIDKMYLGKIPPYIYHILYSDYFKQSKIPIMKIYLSKKKQYNKNITVDMYKLSNTYFLKVGTHTSWTDLPAVN